MNKHQLCSPTTTYNNRFPISSSTKDEKIKIKSSVNSNCYNENSAVEMEKCTCRIKADNQSNKQTSMLGHHISDSDLSDSKSVNSTDQFFQNLKTSRIPYSLSEDEEILKFVLKDNNIFKTSSISLWKLLEQKKGNLPRSYQSLKNRFYRNIKPLILKKFRKFLTDELINNLLIKFPELKKDLHYIPSLQDSKKRIESTSKDIESGTISCPTHGNKEFSEMKISTVDNTSSEIGTENKEIEKYENKSPEANNCLSDSEEKLFYTESPKSTNVSDLKKQVSRNNLSSETKTVNSSPMRNVANEENSKSSSSEIEIIKPVENSISDSPDVVKNLESAVMNIFHEEKRTSYRFVLPVSLQSLQNSNQHSDINKVNIPNIDLNIVLVNNDGNFEGNENSESLLSKSDPPLNININVTLNGFKYSTNNNQVNVNDENEILKNTEENNCVNQKEIQELNTNHEKRILKRKEHNLKKKKRLIANTDSVPTSIFTFKKLESLSPINKARLSALLIKLKQINQRKKTSVLSNENSKTVEKCSSISTNKTSPKKLENVTDDTKKTVIIKTLSQKDDDEESSSLESTNCSTEDDSSYSEILEDLQRTHKVRSQKKYSESEKYHTSQSKDFNSPRKRNLRSDSDMQQKEWKKKKLELNNSFNLNINTSLENTADCSTPKKEKPLEKADKSLLHTNVGENKNKIERSSKLLSNMIKSFNGDVMDNICLRETRSSTRRKILDKV